MQAKKRQKVPDGPKALYSKPDEVIKGDVSPSALNVFDMIRGRAVSYTHLSLTEEKHYC